MSVCFDPIKKLGNDSFTILMPNYRGKKAQNTQLFNSFHTGKFCMLFCRLDIFFKLTFSKKSFRNTIRVANSLEPDQIVEPDLGPNCLQRISADDKSCH